MIKVGETAPDFSLRDQTGALVSLSVILQNGPVILYFYPVDFSPVCTTQACAYRDEYPSVAEVGVQIVGVSPQDVDTHRRFAESYSVPFPLLADPTKVAIKAFGVDGPMGFGVRRATFFIDAQGSVKNRVVSDFFVGSHLDLIKSTLTHD